MPYRTAQSPKGSETPERKVVYIDDDTRAVRVQGCGYYLWIFETRGTDGLGVGRWVRVASVCSKRRPDCDQGFRESVLVKLLDRCLT